MIVFLDDAEDYKSSLDSADGITSSDFNLLCDFVIFEITIARSRLKPTLSLAASIGSLTSFTLLS